ncbi:zinc metalloprotease [Tenacibaculum xiamenense]|uniref:hypothetical protein n=1 Tax=Tenacibaculum xiamenense TaxID=1261553 RepID=UPI0038931867
MKKNAFHFIFLLLIFNYFIFHKRLSIKLITPEAYKKRYHDILKQIKSKTQNRKTFKKVRILVQNHVSREDDEFGPAVTPDYVNKTMEILNKGISSMNIEFISAGPIHYINKTRLHKGELSQSKKEKHILNSHVSPNMLNIFHLKKFAGSNKTSGYSFMPGNSDYDYIALNATFGTTNLEQALVTDEAGHYFELHHTFLGVAKSLRRDEKRNCDIYGEKLCDAPADLQDK